MGTGRKFNKKPVTRPKKALRERRRRETEQKKRLVELGMDEAVVTKMNAKEVRTKLRHPKKVQPAS